MQALAAVMLEATLAYKCFLNLKLFQIAQVFSIQ